MKGLVIFIGDNTSIGTFKSLHDSINIQTEDIPLSEALNSNFNKNPDVVVLDCGRRFFEGLHLVKKIKSVSPSSVIIFVSEPMSNDTPLKVFKAGAREYLPKPINLERLKVIIQEFIRLKKATRERRVPYHDVLESEVFSIDSINLVLNYIEENLSEDISLSKLADIASLSKYHFCRVFKARVGLSPMKYLCQRRLEKAKELLQKMDLPVAAVAAEVGFNDIGNFVKKFKAYTGITPSGYKKMFRRS